MELLLNQIIGKLAKSTRAESNLNVILYVLKVPYIMNAFNQMLKGLKSSGESELYSEVSSA